MSATAASAVYNAFYESLPNKPYCSNDLSFGLKIRQAKTAILHKYIQHNTPYKIKWLVFDIDEEFSWTRSNTAGLPVPAWITWNRENRHAHVAYGLKTPVLKTNTARLKPIKYLAAIERAYAKKLNADTGYAGLVTKNPLHSSWEVWMPDNSRGIYTLEQLASCVDFSDFTPKKSANDDSFGYGRNVTTFDDLRHWAYVAIRQGWPTYERWFEAVLTRAQGINVQFSQPLPYSEIKATARSVAKWTHKHFDPASLQDLIDRTHTPELQAERGRLGGIKSGKVRLAKTADKRSEALVLRQCGMSQRAIAVALGVNQSTVVRWLK